MVEKLIQQLNASFSLKQLGSLDYFLGIEVHSLSSEALLMTQSKYIRDLLNRTNMLEAKPISSPMVSSCKLSKHGSDLLQDASFYRSAVGALQYVTITHPELSFAVIKVCQFMFSPLESHWTAVKRILRYLKGAVHSGLVLYPASTHQPLSIQGFCDSDWASDQDDRRSTFGGAVYVGPNLVGVLVGPKT